MQTGYSRGASSLTLYSLSRTLRRASSSPQIHESVSRTYKQITKKVTGKILNTWQGEKKEDRKKFTCRGHGHDDERGEVKEREDVHGEREGEYQQITS